MVTMLLIHLADNGIWCLVGPLKEEPYHAVRHTNLSELCERKLAVQGLIIDIYRLCHLTRYL